MGINWVGSTCSAEVGVVATAAGSRSAVAAVGSGVAKATKGLFVTTSTFSASAKETAEHLSKRIVLVDGDQLARLMIRHNVGCRIEDTLHIKKIDEEFFE